jgi:hypothetical protein
LGGMTDPQAICISAIAVAAVTGSSVATGVLFIRQRSTVLFVRGLCAASIVVVVVGMPWLTDFLLLRFNTTGSMSRVFIDLGWPGLLFPAIVVACVSIVVARRFRTAAQLRAGADFGPPHW